MNSFNPFHDAILRKLDVPNRDDDLTAGGYSRRSCKSGPPRLANRASSLGTVGVRPWASPVHGGQEVRVQIRLSGYFKALWIRRTLDNLS